MMAEQWGHILTLMLDLDDARAGEAMTAVLKMSEEERRELWYAAARLMQMTEQIRRWKNERP